MSLSEATHAGQAFLAGGSAALPWTLPEINALRPVDVAALPRLPYGDANFSARVLTLHLDTTTDEASRRPAAVRAQVDWMVQACAWRQPRSVYHPMCGPGLFAQMLRGRVNRYHGVDIGPATAAHAAATVGRDPRFSFHCGDALAGCFCDDRHEVALLTYETLNAAPPAEAHTLLCSIARALVSGGHLVAEVRLRRTTDLPTPRRSVRICPQGSLFSARPHVLLTETAVVLDGHVELDRFIVVDEDMHQPPVSMCSIVWTYTPQTLRAALQDAGFACRLVAHPFCAWRGYKGMDRNGFVVAVRQ